MAAAATGRRLVVSRGNRGFSWQWYQCQWGRQWLRGPQHRHCRRQQRAAVAALREVPPQRQQLGQLRAPPPTRRWWWWWWQQRFEWQLRRWQRREWPRWRWRGVSRGGLVRGRRQGASCAAECRAHSARRWWRKESSGDSGPGAGAHRQRAQLGRERKRWGGAVVRERSAASD